MAAKRKPEPRRVRLTVPAADTSTAEWLDHQDDVSASLRLLVRESIQRDGYVDVVNRPVEQQPRRARPPQSGSTGDERYEDDRTDDRTDGRSEETAETEESANVTTSENSTPVIPALSSDDSSSVIEEVSEETEEFDIPAGEQAPEFSSGESAENGDLSPTGQLEMDDIFGRVSR